MITTETKEIQSLVASMRDGLLLIPELQRSYVWKSTQVRDLFDSLYHQYPSGQLLVWETDDLPFAHAASLAEISAGDRKARLLLDGQQRLTSLAGIMLGTDFLVRDRKRTIDIVFNVFDETFDVANAAHHPQAGWISLTKLYTKGTMPTFGELKLDFNTPEAQTALNRLTRVDAIKTYKYQVDVLEDLGYEEVTDIFVRVNSGGTHLSTADLVLAQISSMWRGVTKELDDYRQKIKLRGWELDDTILLRVLAAFVTNQATLSQFFRRGRDKNPTVDQLRAAWDRAKPAMDQAVEFLIHNCAIDRLSMLPTNYVLVPLAVFFDCYGKSVSPQQSRDIQRWLYMALMWSRYSTSSETNLDQDITSLGKEQPIQGMIRNIEDRIGPRRMVTERELQDQLSNSPSMVMAYVLARRASAYDWFNGVAIGAGQDLEYHHIFPKALLKERYELRQDSRVVNQVANLAFLSAKANARISDHAPAEYLEGVSEEYLRAQCVPLDRSLWALDRFEDFVLERRRLLADAINKLLNSLTEEPQIWVGSDAPILKARVADSEDQLRALLAERLIARYGEDAWRRSVPPEIQQSVEDRIGMREREHPYEKGQYDGLAARTVFLQFGDYTRIIKPNWELFADVFGNKKEMEYHFGCVQDVRNAFAHGREPNQSELAHAEGGLIWIEECLRRAAQRADGETIDIEEDELVEATIGATPAQDE